MKGLAELVVSLCDLCEAEGRLLEAGILRTVRRVGLLSLGLLFGAAALALVLAALYALLTSLLPTPAALALLGGASTVIAAGLLWSARDRAVTEDRGETRAEGPEKKSIAQEESATTPAQPPARSHDPWADVAPYGHGAATEAPARKMDGQKGPAPDWPNPRMQGNR